MYEDRSMECSSSQPEGGEGHDHTRAAAQEPEGRARNKPASRLPGVVHEFEYGDSMYDDSSMECSRSQPEGGEWHGHTRAAAQKPKGRARAGAQSVAAKPARCVDVGSCRKTKYLFNS